MSFTQDNKSSSTLTQDNRDSNSSFTQDNRTIAGSLWTININPWQLDSPWLWQGNGQQVTLDPRHNG